MVMRKTSPLHSGSHNLSWRLHLAPWPVGKETFSDMVYVTSNTLSVTKNKWLRFSIFFINIKLFCCHHVKESVCYLLLLHHHLPTMFHDYFKGWAIYSVFSVSVCPPCASSLIPAVIMSVFSWFLHLRSSLSSSLFFSPSRVRPPLLYCLILLHMSTPSQPRFPLSYYLPSPTLGYSSSNSAPTHREPYQPS